MTIVAVTDFDVVQLRDKLLINSIGSARDGLKSFFETNFKVTPTLFTTHDETKVDFLRTWLFRDLAQDSAVHLVFFLSHEFAVYNADSSTFKNESFWHIRDGLE